MSPQNMEHDKKGDLQKGDGSVAIAILTYKRPKMLNTLLASCASAPEMRGIRPIFLVIDNDAEASAQKVVEPWRDQLDFVHYICEPRRGIPIARNRALDEALLRNASALCFIDDDEYPEREWLTRMVDCWRSFGADLIGGPVGVAPPFPNANAWQRFINRSLAARMRRKNRRTSRAASTNGRFTIITNNWLCDLNWLRRTGIRFDESLLFSGGSDTAFFRAAQAAGCKTAWCPEARVYETLPLERLSLAYQFKRAAAQSVTRFHLKNAKVTPKVAIFALAVASARFLLGAVLFFLPVYGIASPMIAIRSMGWSIGRLQALIGKKSDLYK